MCYRAEKGEEGGGNLFTCLPKNKLYFFDQSINSNIFILRARWKPTEFNPQDFFKKGVGWGGEGSFLAVIEF